MPSLRPTFLAPSVILAVIVPTMLQADATIRYTTQIASGAVAPHDQTRVIRMKDTKGLTTEGTMTTIIDFARSQVTVFDSASRLYATLSLPEYAQASSDLQKSVMPASTSEMLKSMKIDCDSKPPAPSDDVAGLHSVEQEVNCTMTMDMSKMPQISANMPQMPAMTMKMSMRTWWPSDEERSRTPGLWQLTDFEQAQSLLFRQDADNMFQGAFKPMRDAMSKSGSVMLRSTMEMSMAMGGTNATPLTKMESNAVEVSSAPIDDSEFAVPDGYTKSTYAEIENANMQATTQAMRTPAQPAAQSKPTRSAGDVKAYVPMLIPVTQTEPEIPAGADKNGGMVDVLATINPQGAVIQAEALSGPAALRQTAIDAVKKWTYRPVLRDGAPVTAYTDAQVFFFSDTASGPPPVPSVDDAFINRITDLERDFSRTPEQTLADAEQDASGRDPDLRFMMLPDLATQALHLDAWDKAKSLTAELIEALPKHAGQSEYADAHFNGHMALGLIALHNNDVATAGQELLESARISGSPVLSSFGPNMWLADELLRKGESPTVLDFIVECRAFWQSGSSQLDAWTDTIHKGGIPVFGGNLR